MCFSNSWLNVCFSCFFVSDFCFCKLRLVNVSCFSFSVFCFALHACGLHFAFECLGHLCLQLPLFTYWGRSYFCFYCIRMSFVFLFACSCPFCIAFLLFCILLARFLVLFNELPGLLILLGLLFFLYSFSGLCLLSSLLGFIAFACALPFAFASSF